EYFAKMAASCQAAGLAFSWSFAEDNSIHARHIVIDNGWKILLDRGLDIFQRYEMNDAFSIANRMQQFRPCKAFEATFLRADSLPAAGAEQGE
ncbi:MAG: ATP-dependent Lon protease, partial [Chloroflexi bacterium]